MLTRWLIRRAALQLSARFTELCTAGHSVQALDLLSAAPPAVLAEVHPMLHAVRDLLTSMQSRRPDDIDRFLANDLGAWGVDGQQTACVSRLAEFPQLIAAVRGQASGSFSPHEWHKSGCNLLERMAIALSLWQRGGQVRGGPAQRGQLVLEVLPPVEEDVAPYGPLRDRLFLLAAQEAGRLADIAEAAGRLNSLSVEDRRRLQRGAACRVGRTAVREGRLSDARRMRALLSEADSPESALRQATYWGIQEMVAAPEAAIAWLQELNAGQGAPDPWSLLAQGLGYVLRQQTSQAAETLDAVAECPRPDAAGEQAESSLAGTALYLRALSLLAAAHDLPDPESATDPAEQTQIRISNRSQWQRLQEELRQVCRQLAEGDVEMSSRGAVLEGLAMYAEHSATASPEFLQRFWRAVEQFPGDAARDQLKQVAATLTARARAAEEAAELLRDDRVVELRQLYESLFRSRELEIPQMLRSAVALRLAYDDPAFDSGTDLTSAASGADEQALLDQARATLAAVRAAALLARHVRHRSPPQEPPPRWETMAAIGPQAAAPAAHGLALLAARNQEWNAVRQILSLAGELDSETSARLLLLAAAQVGTIGECEQLLARSWSGDYRPGPSARRGLAARTLIAAVEASDSALAAHALQTPRQIEPTNSAGPLVYRLLVWMIQDKRFDLAAGLLRMVLQAGGPADEDGLLIQVCLSIRALVMAALSQYVACLEAVDEFLNWKAPRQLPKVDDFDFNRMVTWNRLCRVYAEMGSVLTAPQAGARAQALHRALGSHIQGWEADRVLQPYSRLISGLLAAFGTAASIDSESLEALRRVRGELEFKKRGAFIEGLVGRLTWRRQVLQAFRDAMEGQQYERALQLYEQEMVAALGNDVPAAVRVLIAWAEWNTGRVKKDAAEERMRAQARLLPPAHQGLVAGLLAQLSEADQLQQIQHGIRNGDFARALSLCTEGTWQGRTDPEPVKLARLYALFRLLKYDEFGALVSQIRNTNVARPTADRILLLDGYVLFRSNRPEQAAESFGRISQPRFLNHDADRYLAVCQFSQGLRLMEQDSPALAFAAFSLALSKGAQHVPGNSLPELLVHFGLKAIDARQGARAAKAFELLAGQLPDEPQNLNAVRARTVARIGVYLCDVLAARNLWEPSDRTFLKLVADIQRQPGADDESQRHWLRLLHILAVCAELRRQVKMKTEQDQNRLAPAGIAKFLDKEVAELERLQTVPEGVPAPPADPVLLVLKGLLLLQKGGKQAAEAIPILEEARKLAVKSRRIVQILADHEAALKKLRDKQQEVLTLFDVYLTRPVAADAGNFQNWLTAHDEISDLYELGRQYRPVDVQLDAGPSPAQEIQNRLRHLHDYLNRRDNSPEHKGLVRKLEKQMQQWTQLETATVSLEKEILSLVAASLRKQSIG